MNTKEAVEGYFERLKRHAKWDTYLADDVQFTSHTSPIRRVTGRDAFLGSTQRFYGMITAVEVKELVIDGERAVALTRYTLQPPAGESFTSDVAEVFGVSDGKIVSFDIYFDTAPYPR